jgi:hypothetical protein
MNMKLMSVEAEDPTRSNVARHCLVHEYTIKNRYSS